MVYETQDGVNTIGSNSTPPSGGGGSNIEVQDEGNVVASVSKINFIGKNVSAINDNVFGRVNVDIPLEDIYKFSCYKDRVANNVWLKSSNGLFLLKSPFIVPLDSFLYAVAVSVNSASSFFLDFYKNADIVAVPNLANAIYSFSVVSSDSGLTTGLSIPLAAGDKVGVYFRGNSKDVSCSFILRRS